MNSPDAIKLAHNVETRASLDMSDETHSCVDHFQNEIVAIYMKNSYFDGGSGVVAASNFEKDVFASFAE